MNLVEWPRRVAALAQLRVADPATPRLSRGDDHHLRTVLRARPDEEFVVTDGRGTWAIATAGDEGVMRVSPVYVDPPIAATTLYLVPLKGDRSEWAIAKVTELGVARIVPLLAQRQVVKFKGDARDRVLERWRRIAAEACGQARRTHDVVIDDPVKVRDVPVNVAVADLSGEGDWRGVTDVAVGPEGGWASEEWQSERRRLSLGPTVLRAETAGVVAASLLAFTNGGWGFAAGGLGLGNDEGTT